MSSIVSVADLIRVEVMFVEITFRWLKDPNFRFPKQLANNGQNFVIVERIHKKKHNLLFGKSKIFWDS